MHRYKLQYSIPSHSILYPHLHINALVFCDRQSADCPADTILGSETQCPLYNRRKAVLRVPQKLYHVSRSILLWPDAPIPRQPLHNRYPTIHIFKYIDCSVPTPRSRRSRFVQHKPCKHYVSIRSTSHRLRCTNVVAIICAGRWLIDTVDIG
jgi:hypothetical protein